jgi:hypothetical protein
VILVTIIKVKLKWREVMENTATLEKVMDEINRMNEEDLNEVFFFIEFLKTHSFNTKIRFTD